MDTSVMITLGSLAYATPIGMPANTMGIQYSWL